MADGNWQAFNTDLITAMNENVNWLEKTNWASFSAIANFSISLMLIAEQGDDFQDCDYATIIRSAPDENGIFVGQKGKSLLAMFYGDSGSVIIQYNTEDKSGSYQIFDEIKSQGKMTVFIVGDYKERKIIDTFLHVDVESYAHESQALAEAFMKNRDTPDPNDIPPPSSSHWVESGDYEGYIRSRVAWGEGYINDDGEFVEFD